MTGEFTNWRGPAELRGSELLINVANGSDADRVLQILAQVASQHPLVLRAPATQGLLTGFTDNV